MDQHIVYTKSRILIVCIKNSREKTIRTKFINLSLKIKHANIKRYLVWKSDQLLCTINSAFGRRFSKTISKYLYSSIFFNWCISFFFICQYNILTNNILIIRNFVLSFKVLANSIY